MALLGSVDAVKKCQIETCRLPCGDFLKLLYSLIFPYLWQLDAYPQMRPHRYIFFRAQPTVPKSLKGSRHLLYSRNLIGWKLAILMIGRKVENVVIWLVAHWQRMGHGTYMRFLSMFVMPSLLLLFSTPCYTRVTVNASISHNLKALT